MKLSKHCTASTSRSTNPLLVLLISLAGLLLVQTASAHGFSFSQDEIVRPLRARITPPAAIHGTTNAPQRGGTRDINTFITDRMAAKHIAGLQAAIVIEGRVAWSGAYGLADPTLSIPVDHDTLFMLASISKTVTGATLMLLVDQGLVDLDDVINDHLPFTVTHPFHPTTDMTVRMLLTHTASIRDNWGVMHYYPGDSPYPLGDYLEDYLTPGGAIYNANKNFYGWQPGNGWNYCNNALALAGYLVEAVTGRAFDDFSAQNLLTPLGMDNTAWLLADLDPADIAMPCYWTGSTWGAYGHYGYSDYPSGQLRTSANQLAHFLIMVMQGGQFEGQTILEPASVQEFTTIQFPGVNGSQGLVFYRSTIGGRSVWGHNGGDQGVSTEMHFDPATEIGVIVLTNGEASLTDITDALFDYGEGQGCGTANYCVGAVNSTGLGAVIGSTGSVSVVADDLVLTASQCPAGQYGLFFYGSGRTQTPLADGFMCVESNFARLPAIQTDGTGHASYPLDYDNLPPYGGQITPGSTWNFQFWYRDPASGGSGSNFTDGLEAAFCP